jgi:hypothetical protein
MARPKPIAELIESCIAPAMAAKGFAVTDVVLSWPEIVGERLAAHTEPLRMEWPRAPAAPTISSERPAPATLVIRVAGAFALELQHCAPLVVERVNAHFGWRCVGRIALRQGPLQRRDGAKAPAPTLDPSRESAVDSRVRDIPDAGLRDALARLGRGVLSRAP